MVRIYFKIKRLGLSHLVDNFQDCVNPICSCGQGIEIATCFLLHCPNYCCARSTFFGKTSKID